MTFQTTRQLSSTYTPTGAETFAVWRNVLSPVIEILRQMAGTTEDEFLQIGSQLQSFYQRAADTRSGQSATVVQNDAKNSVDDSEFGDNVDLF